MTAIVHVSLLQAVNQMAYTTKDKRIDFGVKITALKYK